MSTAEASIEQPNYSAIKEKQKIVWSAGDYARIGSTLQIVGENLAEAMDLRADDRVLDIAAGNGNFTLAAARRWADVTSTDYVEDLLFNAQQRAEANGLNPTFKIADAEDLPFADGSFDAAGSTYGIMFAPNQQKAAAEMLRVVRKGGKIGMANWTPGSFIGGVLKTVGQYVPPPPGLNSPLLWGTEKHLESLFSDQVAEMEITRKNFYFRYRSADHWLDVFREFYGPLHKAFAAIDEEKQQKLSSDIKALIASMNQSGDDSMLVPGEYLEVVIRR